MRHRRPPRLSKFSYKGKHRYSVTCATLERRKLFDNASIVTVCADQILRTCADRRFRVIAYGFMEDHLHLLLEGQSEDSDFKSTMTVVRQRTATAFSRVRGERLWQDGYYDHVLRPRDDVFAIIRYILDNPRAANLPEERARYPYVWSDPHVDD